MATCQINTNCTRHDEVCQCSGQQDADWVVEVCQCSGWQGADWVVEMCQCSGSQDADEVVEVCQCSGWQDADSGWNVPVRWLTGCRLSGWNVPVQWLTGCRLSGWNVPVQWLTGCRLSSWSVPEQWLTGCRLSQWTRKTCFSGSGLQVCTAMVEISKKLKAVHCVAVQYACRAKKPCFARTQNMWLTWQYKPLLSWPTHCASCGMGSKFPLRIFKENLETTGIFFYYFIIVHRFQILPQVINWTDLFEKWKKSLKISG